MQRFEINKQTARVLIIGRPDSKTVRDIAELLAGLEAEFIHCRDVYSAVAHLAGDKWLSDYIIAGCFTNLNCQNGRFFEILNDRALTCCCIADENFERIDKTGFALKYVNIFVVNSRQELEDFLEKQFLYSGQLDKAKTANTKDPFDNSKFIPTKTELDALFGA